MILNIDTFELFRGGFYTVLAEAPRQVSGEDEDLSALGVPLDAVVKAGSTPYGVDGVDGTGELYGDTMHGENHGKMMVSWDFHGF